MCDGYGAPELLDGYLIQVGDMIGRKFDRKPLEWHLVLGLYERHGTVSLRVERPDGKVDWVDRGAGKRVQVRRVRQV